jgi:hypothetical protein
MTRGSDDDTQRIASAYAARVAQARTELATRMRERGLKTENGWRLYEEVVNTPEGIAFLLRPVHRLESTPEDLRILVPFG